MLLDLYSCDSCLLEGLFSFICDKNFPFILEIIIFQELVKKKYYLLSELGRANKSSGSKKANNILISTKIKFNWCILSKLCSLDLLPNEWIILNMNRDFLLSPSSQVKRISDSL